MYNPTPSPQFVVNRAVMVLPFLEGPVLGLFMQKNQSFWSFLVLFGPFLKSNVGDKPAIYLNVLPHISP